MQPGLDPATSGLYDWGWHWAPSHHKVINLLVQLSDSAAMISFRFSRHILYVEHLSHFESHLAREVRDRWINTSRPCRWKKNTDSTDLFGTIVVMTKVPEKALKEHFNLFEQWCKQNRTCVSPVETILPSHFQFKGFHLMKCSRNKILVTFRSWLQIISSKWLKTFCVHIF